MKIVVMKHEVWGLPESICRSQLTLFIEAIKTLHFSSLERCCFFAEQEK